MTAFDRAAYMRARRAAARTDPSDSAVLAREILGRSNTGFKGVHRHALTNEYHAWIDDERKKVGIDANGEGPAFLAAFNWRLSKLLEKRHISAKVIQRAKTRANTFAKRMDQWTGRKSAL